MDSKDITVNDLHKIGVRIKVKCPGYRRSWNNPDNQMTEDEEHELTNACHPELFVTSIDISSPLFTHEGRARNGYELEWDEPTGE
jgi:hypothetical protein|tara:strand:- start:508 stop:762 length:255 start_codon:yes stop_codon:yes gene_type:complete